MNRFLSRYGDIALTLVLIFVFSVWPSLDLDIARRIYRPGVGFPLEDRSWVGWIYHIVADAWIVALIWLTLLVAGFVPRFKAHWAPRRRMLAYLLVVLVVGPGLIVNAALKDHWGRARPLHLAEFGGSASYSAPLVPSDQCRHNCAFVSGHAAASFYVMAGFWVTRRRRWLAAGIGLGMVLGYIRIGMGGHFVSDIVFAGVVVHFTCRFFAWAFRLPPYEPKKKPA